MKYLAWLGGVLLTLVATVYIVVFTPVGNSLIKPLLEDKINEQTNLDSKLNLFSLGVSNFEIVLELNRDNIVKAKGYYSLFSKSFDIFYEVNLKNLQSLKELVGTPLNGSLYTDGKVKGDMSFMEVDGKSNVGDGDTTYHVELTELNPTSIIASMKNAKLASLLYLGAQNPYASADIDLDINFKNIKPHVMDGDIVLKSTNGTINPKYMKSDFNVTIPKTSFAMNMDAKLKGDDIDYNYILSSNLFNINSSGKVAPKPLKMDIEYLLDVEDLEVLKPITQADVRGSFKLRGTAKGTKESLVVEGRSDLASSDTVFKAVLRDFKPASLNAKVDNLDIAKLLYMVKQPHYSDGYFSMNADIKDARADKLDGKVVTSINRGILDSAYLTKTYEFKSLMPKTAYNSTTVSLLNGSVVDTKVDFNSDIVNLDIQNAKFNIKDSSLKSDYTVDIKNLDKLFFVTDQHMRGGLRANGDISKAKDLDLTFHTKVAEGKIDAKLHNDDFSADLNSVKTRKILYMLTYPELVDALLNAKINYNLAQSRGTFRGQVANTVFTKNQVFDLIKQYVKFDMYKEFFKGDVNADINKEKIVASVDLVSQNASIKTNSTKLNTKTEQIDTDLILRVKEDEISATIKGDMNSPNVSVDLEKFMKSQAGKKVKEKINKAIGDKAGDLFKKLF